MEGATAQQAPTRLLIMKAADHPGLHDLRLPGD